MEHHHLSGADELSELAQGYEKIILEIGFGNGENTAFLAAKNPKALVVASEVYLSGIGSLLNSIAQNSLNNIKIYDDDVRELLLKLPNEIFDEIYIICPDPWPKARHHKRRLIKYDFLKVLGNVLREEGTVYISTDWENYAESIEEEAEKSKQNFLFKKISNEGMPITRFQQRAINEGRSIHTFLLSVLKK
ncbi:tRNA (guanosine(46)-N7)-methyltransferase TrmB [Gammaproteobacteria bacterium]|nr:tRNA (guanosine(46)-N7)-methyltransferase TrmB [Gammaproteobacteria bacterium]MDB3881416.1 tRNA (guanosine(46)-N7)-methyltransferase TrmB [Gammaproteobacteria bacterium]MDC0905854.1 tRNA (guanosine(46)-N7)-methyltransferase TrmB [Gammaproteobacteria bacterium]